MSTSVPLPQPSANILRSHSLGVKFFIVLLLAFGMSISGFFVEGLTRERADRHGVLAASSENAPEQPKTVLGIRLADSYRSVRRSLHYITLFLGLVFLTVLSLRSHDRKERPPSPICSGRHCADYLLSSSTFIGGASRLRPQFPDCRRIHCGSVLGQYGLGVSKPQARAAGTRGIHTALCLYLCAFACRGLRFACGSYRQLLLRLRLQCTSRETSIGMETVCRHAASPRLVRMGVLASLGWSNFASR